MRPLQGSRLPDAASEVARKMKQKSRPLRKELGGFT